MRNILPAIMTTALGLVSANGCYDGEQLVKLARAEATHSLLEEVELGQFRTTLPMDPQSPALTEMTFHLFGTTSPFQRPKIEKQLEEDGYRLKYATLAAVRQASSAELAEPDFAKILERILKVANEILEDSPIENVGFSNVSLVHH